MFFQDLMVPSGWVLNSIAFGDGISIDQLMLGIGEVWYFSTKIGVFSRFDGSIGVGVEQHCVW